MDWLIKRTNKKTNERQTEWLTDLLTGRPTDWLTEGLTDERNGALSGWWKDWITGCVTLNNCRLTDCLSDQWTAHWKSVKRLTDWNLTEKRTDKLADWVTKWETERPVNWLNLIKWTEAARLQVDPNNLSYEWKNSFISFLFIRSTRITYLMSASFSSSDECSSSHWE